MLLFIRHGERADMVDNPDERKKVLLKFDPPLTEKGEYQARITGQQLRKELEEFTKQKQIAFQDLSINFISSPFLRCIQTAAILMKQIPNNSNLYIQDEIGELMYSHSFKQNILMQLHINTLQHPILTNDYIDGILITREKFIKTKLIQPIYPEEYDQCQLRVGKFLQELLTHMNSLQNKNNTIYICVTHQGVVSLTLKIQNVKSPYQVGHCGLSSFILEDNGLIKNYYKGESIWY
ncbi:unnamed protein product [Paramecium primaurelia]|uniref:Phosphoglycerate mutase n=1 Tax=Paramecium primaurelia TaxID=5886 RepID=A0A8S1KQD4_PARPR|nr:unnamed protein product [Paramecium primaurelia]